jgi:selT/selW/selH-like putative selenoprotein
LAAEIEQTLGKKPRLIVGGKGIFDIKLDEQLVFSKHAAGRFPQNKEVIDSLQNLIDR